jgi:hypothetical protein
MQKKATKQTRNASTSNLKTKKALLLTSSKPLSPTKKKNEDIIITKSSKTSDKTKTIKFFSSKRYSTCDPQKVPSIRITEIIKVSHSSELTNTKKQPVPKIPLNIGMILVSPIQKIHIAFVNKEDQSLIKALETIS